MKWLIFGSRGWIGGQLLSHLRTLRPDDTIFETTVRADDEKGVRELLDSTHPDRVVSLIGRTHGEGCNTIDYLEQKGKLVENIRDNLYAPLVLASACKERSIHFAYMGTGCIFTYDEEHPNPETNPSAKGFLESSAPNYVGSSYSVVKGFTDRILSNFYHNTLNLRIRMPITGDLSHPRNFITKILNYPKICSVQNSMTVLPELLPIMIDLIVKGHTGTINLTNPNTISHNEILEMYKNIIDPTFTWENFTQEEQRAILAADRSNNLLDTSRLQTLYPMVKPIHVAIKELFQGIKDSNDVGTGWRMM